MKVAAPPAPVSAPKCTGERLQAAFPEVERLFQDAMAARPVPNLAIGVVAGGELAWSRGYGTRAGPGSEPVTAETVFRIGSVTKVLAGMALLQLRDAGRLRLDEPVVKYLPEFAEVVYPTRDSPPITLRHLVTHSSGLPRLGTFDYTHGRRAVSEEELLGSLKQLRLEFVPGMEVRYSNLGMGLVGLVVQRVSGQPFREYVNEHVLAPLGMRQSVWDMESVRDGRLATGYVWRDGAYVPGGAHWRLGAAEAMGGLYSSVADMARLMEFELAAWPPRDGPDDGPLRRSSLRESQLPAGPALGGQAMGVSWLVSQQPDVGHVVFHNGATFDYSASVMLLPGQGLGMVVLAGVGGERAPELDQLVRRSMGMLSAACTRESEVALPPSLLQGVDHLKALMHEPRAERLREHLSARFLERMPPEGLLGLLTHLQSQLGACTSHRVERVEEGGQAIIRLACERGAVEATLAVEPGAPHLLTLLLLRPAR